MSYSNNKTTLNQIGSRLQTVSENIKQSSKNIGENDYNRKLSSAASAYMK